MRTIRLVFEKGWYGRIRTLIVKVDGREVARMRQGQSIVLTIPDGAGELCGQIDWGKTEPYPLHAIVDGDVLVLTPYFTFNLAKGLGVTSIPVRIAKR